jgi:hypothetical protein
MNPDHDPAGSPTEPEDAEARRAEERFVEDLSSRGEMVPEGQELSPGATHEEVDDDQGRRAVRRRFKAY